MQRKTIELDENWDPIDRIAERNVEIKNTLAPLLEAFLEEKNENRAYKYKEKLGYRFAKQIFLVLSDYPRMSPERFAKLSYEDIESYWINYLELTAYYNRHFEIVDNKQLLMAFVGINSRQYAELENSEDEDIRNLMNSINSTFVGLGFVAGESGNADVKATSQRMRAKGEGHNLISASEDKLIEKVEAQTPAQMMTLLQSIVGNEPKKLNGAK